MALTLTRRPGERVEFWAPGETLIGVLSVTERLEAVWTFRKDEMKTFPIRIDTHPHLGNRVRIRIEAPADVRIERAQ